MEVISDALRQAFMPKQEYQSLRDEQKTFLKLTRPISVAFLCVLSIAIVLSVGIRLKIMFPSDPVNRPFCYENRLEALPIDASSERGDSKPLPGAFYLTDQETVDYYYLMLFLPSLILFFVSAVYLVAGILVAYSAP